MDESPEQATAEADPGSIERRLQEITAFLDQFRKDLEKLHPTGAINEYIASVKRAVAIAEGTVKAYQEFLMDCGYQFDPEKGNWVHSSPWRLWLAKKILRSPF